MRKTFLTLFELSGRLEYHSDGKNFALIQCVLKDFGNDSLEEILWDIRENSGAVARFYIRRPPAAMSQFFERFKG